MMQMRFQEASMGIISAEWKGLPVVRFVLRIRSPLILLQVVHRTKFCVFKRLHQIKDNRIIREFTTLTMFTCFILIIFYLCDMSAF